MNVLHSPLRRIVALTAFALVALAMAGCTKKVTVDPGYVQPEGRTDADARLIVYPDLPITVQTWTDLLPDGPGLEDTLVSTVQVSVSPGSVYGTIMDGTPASAYQVLRRERNGGFAQLDDYLVNPTLRFLDSQWELYTFKDSHPSGFTPATYLGRGVIAGQVTSTSPLTNLGEQAGTVAPLIYTGEAAPVDSNITMSWQPVTGAVGYWIQIYQFQGSTEAQLLAARPAPFVPLETRNMFIGYVPAPATSYKLGEEGAMVLTRRPLLRSVQYFVRISAVNAQGEMIAFTYGDPNGRVLPSFPGIIRGVSDYRFYLPGAYAVLPSLPHAPN